MDGTEEGSHVHSMSLSTGERDASPLSFPPEAAHVCAKTSHQEKTPLKEAPAELVPSILTDTDRGLSRPLVVLQAYPNRRPHQPEARIALVNHSVPVTEAIPADVTIHNRIRGAAVAGYKHK